MDAPVKSKITANEILLGNGHVTGKAMSGLMPPDMGRAFEKQLAYGSDIIVATRVAAK